MLSPLTTPAAIRWEVLIHSGIKEFELDNYEDAEIIVQGSYEKVDKIISDSLLFGVVAKSKLKFSIINFTKKFWWLILICVAILSVFAKIIYRLTSTKLLQNKNS